MQFTITRPKRETLFAKTKACSKNQKKSLQLNPNYGPSLQQKEKSQIGPSFKKCTEFLETYRIFLIKNSSLLGQVDFQGAFFLHLYQYKKGAESTKNLWHFFAHSVLEALPQAKKVWRVYTQKVIIMVMLAMSIYFQKIIAYNHQSQRLKALGFHMARASLSRIDC